MELDDLDLDPLVPSLNRLNVPNHDFLVSSGEVDSPLMKAASSNADGTVSVHVS